MDILELATIPIKDIHLVTKNEVHLPSKNSLRELKYLVSVPPLLLTLFLWDEELYYVNNFL
ncbi:hypothetical protein [Peribacillus loiseleuriae]|uniref:Uncharacterized protein n=1 Tax=Peribacillus loiseleuriae TaxID=1679170 RepID=A0A0K9GWK2_9BACI|nr:hypothetical protein [Peribacillus loiseleuriae]KMY51020.1 hypothetical protein AC625_17035 [Peribacillus loiseleuriae]